MRRRRLFAIAYLGLALLGFQVGAAHAYVWQDWYGYRWTTGVQAGQATDRNLNWRFVDVDEPEGFPSGDGGRDAFRRATEEWNDEGQSLTFTESSPNWLAYEWGGCPSGYQSDKVAWEHIDGDPQSHDTVGETYRCFISGTNVSKNFMMHFDSGNSWYKGSSTSVPSGKVDLQSVATHELGHATGWNRHWDAPDPNPYLCPGSGPDHHTMCSNVKSGTYGQRSLEIYDKAMFGDAY